MVKSQPFQVITLQIGVTRTNQLTKYTTSLKHIMTFMTQQKHHSNNLDMSGPGLAKHVYEERIISMLASTEFPPTSFSWKILKTQPAKTEASRFGGFLLHWKHSKKDMLSGIQYAILFLPKKTLIALQYYDTAC